MKIVFNLILISITLIPFKAQSSAGEPPLNTGVNTYNFEIYLPWNGFENTSIKNQFLLHQEVRNGNFYQAEILLENYYIRSQIFHRDAEGLSPIHYTINIGQFSFVKKLINLAFDDIEANLDQYFSRIESLIEASFPRQDEISRFSENEIRLFNRTRDYLLKRITALLERVRVRSRHDHNFYTHAIPIIIFLSEKISQLKEMEFETKEESLPEPSNEMIVDNPPQEPAAINQGRRSVILSVFRTLTNPIRMTRNILNRVRRS